MLGWIQRWLQDLLTQVIGPFVEVPSESLQFSLRNGRVFMSDVVLRTRQIESSLASGLGLQMPVAIKRGKVSHLQLQIPWMNLIYGKIVLRVSGIEVVLRERTEDEWEGKQAEERSEAEKQALLANLELELLSRGLQVSSRMRRRDQQGENENEGNAPSGSSREEVTGRDDTTTTTNNNNNNRSVKNKETFNLRSLTTSILSKVGKVLLAKLAICVEDLHIQYEDGILPNSDVLATNENGEVDAITANFLNSHQGSGRGGDTQSEAQHPSTDAAAGILPPEENEEVNVFGLRLGRLESVQEDQNHSRSQDVSPGILVTLEGLSVYTCTISSRKSQEDLEEEEQNILEPMSCTISVNVYHGDQEYGNADFYDVQCVLTHLRLQIDNELLRAVIVLVDKMEIWALRSVYGKYRPDKWRTLSNGRAAASSSSSSSGRQEWARQGWHYALSGVLHDISSKRSRAQRLEKLKMKYPFSYGKYIQLYKQKLIQLASGHSKKTQDAGFVNFLEDFEKKERMEDIIALRSHIGHVMDRDTVWLSHMQGKNKKSVQDSVLSTFWQNWISSDSPTSSHNNLNKIGDIQKFYDKLVEQMPRTPRASTASAGESNSEVLCCFQLEIKTMEIAVAEFQERENPLMEIFISGSLCKIEVMEDNITKASVQTRDVRVNSDDAILIRPIDASRDKFLDLNLEMQRVGEANSLSVKVSCIVEPFACSVPPNESIERFLAFEIPIIETYHLCWLWSTNKLGTHMARSQAKAQYLMQYPYVNFQLIMSEACIYLDGKSDSSLVIRARGTSITSSRNDALECSEKAQLALDAVKHNLDNAPNLVEEHVMYHRLNCTITEIEVGVVYIGEKAEGEKVRIQEKVLSTALWAEMELLLLPDDSTQAVCKANIDFSSMKLRVSSEDLFESASIIQHNLSNMSSMSKIPEDKAEAKDVDDSSTSFTDVRLRFPSILIDAYNFQGIQKPLKDNIRISIKGLKAGIQKNLVENECFVSLCSFKIEQKTDLFSYSLLHFSLQELLRDPLDESGLSGSSSLYENASNSFQKVTPEKKGRELFKGTLNERTWISSSLSFALVGKNGKNQDKTLVFNAFCARINTRFIECAHNISMHFGMHFGHLFGDDADSEDIANSSIIGKDSTHEPVAKSESKLNIHVSISNYMLETDLRNQDKRKCTIKVPKINATILLVSNELKSLQLLEEGLSMSLDAEEGCHFLIEKFDVNTKLAFCQLQSDSVDKTALDLKINVPSLDVSLHHEDIETLTSLADSFSFLSKGTKAAGKKSSPSTSSNLPSDVSLALDIDFLQCKVYAARETPNSIVALSEQLYIQFNSSDGVVGSFECGWRLLGLYFLVKENESMPSRVLLVSLQPKQHGNEIPIIETNASGSMDCLELSIKNVQINVNAFCWAAFLLLADELKKQFEGKFEQPSSEPKKIRMQAFKCSAEDLEININFEDEYEIRSPPVLVRTRLNFALTDDVHQYKAELLVHHLVLDLPLTGLEGDDEGEMSSFKTFAFFDDLSLSLQISDSFDTANIDVDLESLSVWLSHQNMAFLKAALASPTPLSTNEASSSVSKDSQFTASLNLAFKSKKLAALFSDDRFQRDSPIAEIAICDLTTRCSIDPLNMTQVFINFKVVLDFYNYDKVAWEPVVEEWPLHIYYRTCDPSDVRRKSVPSHELLIQSHHQWNINISEYTIETANILQHMLESLALESDPTVFTPRIRSNKFTPYWLQNLTGLTVGYCFSDGSSSSIILSDLRNKEEGQAPDENLVPLYIRKSSGRGGRYVSYSYMNRKFAARKSFISENDQQWVSGRRPVIHFKIKGSTWSNSVAMNTYAKHCITLDSADGMGNKKTEILCDVQRRANGGRLIVLHSCISIKNSCGHYLHIGAFSSVSLEPQCMVILEPGESFWVPVQIALMGSVCFRMTLDSKETSWSQMIKLHDLVGKDSKKKKVLGNCILRGKGQTLSFTVNVEKEGNQFRLRIQPPVKVRNLLPVPLDTVLYRSGKSLLKSSIKPDSELNIHNIRNSSQLSLILRPKGYNWSPGIAIPFRQGESSRNEEQSSHSVREDSVVIQGIDRDDNSTLLVEVKYVGQFPMIIQISCPLWIYNHTGLSLSIRDKEQESNFQQVDPFWRQNDSPDSIGIGSVAPKKAKIEPSGLSIVANIAEEQDHAAKISSKALITHESPKSQKEAMIDANPWPTMFGLKAYHHGIQLQLRVKPAARLDKVITSKVFNLQVLGEPTVIQVVAEEGQQMARFPKAYFFTVSTEISTFGGSSIGVHIRPRFILTNKLNTAIMYRQEGSKVKHELESNGTEAIHADTLSEDPKLCVKLENNAVWSGYFHLDKPGGIQMKMAESRGSESMMLQVDVRELAFETWSISISEYQAGFDPYRIDNFTSSPLSYYQYKCESAEETLQPYSSAVYTWDEPYLSHKVVIKLPGYGALGSFPLDKVGENHVVSVPMSPSSTLNYRIQRKLEIAVKADGPTRVLSISDLSVHVPQKDPSRLPLSNKLLRMITTKIKKERSKEEEPPAQDSIFTLDVQVPHLGLSVIGKSSEILYLGILDLQLKFRRGEKHDAIAFKAKRIQIDNMLPGSPLPVLLSIPAPLYQQESISSVDAITCNLSYWHAKVASVKCIESAVVRVSPILLDMDGSIFFHLHHFTEVLSWVEETSSLTRVSSASSLNNAKEDEGKSARLHFECIKIYPIHMTVSLSTAGLISEKTFLSENPKGVNAQLLYALSFAEFEGVQVLLSGFELNHALIDKGTLQSLMGKHYIKALLKEAVKVLGSANILGDPLGLVQHLGTGMWDFLSKPTVGLLQSARTLGVEQFTAGLSAGSWSLLSHTVYALSNAAFKISKTAHRNVNAVKTRCDMLINSSLPLHKQVGKEPNPSMIGAVSRGIGGIIAAPIHGMEQNGLRGLAEGTTLGLLGAFALPTATLLDFAQHTSKALRDNAKHGILKASRMRPPRKVSEEDALEEYSLNEALGGLVLENMKLGHEEMKFSCLLDNGNQCILVTSQHVMSVKTTSSFDISVDWLYSLMDIVEHSQVGCSATLTLLLPFNHNDNNNAGLPICQKHLIFPSELEARVFDQCFDLQGPSATGGGAKAKRLIKN